LAALCIRRERNVPRELVAVGPGQPVLRDSEDGPVPEGQVRVKVEFGAPKHGTEMVFYRVAREAKFPVDLGNMCVGRVVEVGEGVDSPALGDTVAWYGHLRETHTWQASEVRLLSYNMTWKEAVCFDPAQFALSGIRDGRVRLGDCVAVFGLGAIGQMAAQMARLAGAAFVAAVDPISLRRDVALENGADVALDPTAQDVAAELKKATGNRGVDVVIETSGSYKALNEAMRGLAFGGTVAFVGWSKECKGGLDFGEVAHFTIPNLVFARACSDPNRDHPRWDFGRIMDTCWELLASKQLKCENLVQPVVPFSQSAEAYKEFVELHPERSVKLGVEFE